MLVRTENEESDLIKSEPFSPGEVLISLLNRADPSISAALATCSDSVVPSEQADLTTLHSETSSSSSSSLPLFITKLLCEFTISSPILLSLVVSLLYPTTLAGFKPSNSLSLFVFFLLLAVTLVFIESDSISLMTPATMSRVFPITSATSPFPIASEEKDSSLDLSKIFLSEVGDLPSTNVTIGATGERWIVADFWPSKRSFTESTESVSIDLFVTFSVL
mmetsp:Transcript_46739/g.50425  ORF Transcript_46739/g.50425 Transcript_46739/m.50425 type:complete len:220 (-) Transcript_46739:2067-2726(-)